MAWLSPWQLIFIVTEVVEGETQAETLFLHDCGVEWKLVHAVGGPVVHQIVNNDQAH